MSLPTKEQWIEALRGGKYQQGKGYLRTEKEGNVEHCCLGVLCDLAAAQWEKPEGYTMHPEAVFPDGTRIGRIEFPGDLVKAVMGDSLKTYDGSAYDFCQNLADLNDGNSTFGEIADVIENPGSLNGGSDEDE